MTDLSDPQAALGALLASFETLDFDRIGAMIAEDAVFEFPFSSHGQVLAGKAAILHHLRTVMAGFVTRMRFSVTTVHRCADPQLAIAEYTSEGSLVGGGAYANRYVGLVKVKDGRLALFREYFNPVATMAGAAR